MKLSELNLDGCVFTLNAIPVGGSVNSILPKPITKAFYPNATSYLDIAAMYCWKAAIAALTPKSSPEEVLYAFGLAIYHKQLKAVKIFLETADFKAVPLQFYLNASVPCVPILMELMHSKEKFSSNPEPKLPVEEYIKKNTSSEFITKYVDNKHEFFEFALRMEKFEIAKACIAGPSSAALHHTMDTVEKFTMFNFITYLVNFKCCYNITVKIGDVVHTHVFHKPPPIGNLFGVVSCKGKKLILEECGVKYEIPAKSWWITLSDYGFGYGSYICTIVGEEESGMIYSEQNSQ